MGESKIPVSGMGYIVSYQIPYQGTIYIHHDGNVLIYTDRGGMWTESTAGRQLTEIASTISVEVSRVTNRDIKVINKAGAGTVVTAISFLCPTFSTTAPT